MLPSTWPAARNSVFTDACGAPEVIVRIKPKVLGYQSDPDQRMFDWQIVPAGIRHFVAMNSSGSILLCFRGDCSRQGKIVGL